MKLCSLTMYNFMPFRGEQRIDFPKDSYRNILLVFGNNLHGKTSILNALRWGFYGTALDRHSRPIPMHLLHNKDAGYVGDWKMEVSIQLESLDGHNYDLRRKANKRKLVSTPERPEDFDVELFLMRDGIPISGDAIEHEINQFAPLQVSRFILFDGELLQEYENLLIEGDEKGRRIKEAIEQWLGVPALVHGRDDATFLRKKSQKRQNQDLAHLQSAKGLIEKQHTLQEKVDSCDRDKEKLKINLQKTKDERSELDDEIEKNDSLYKAKITLDGKIETQKELIKDLDLLRGEKLELVSLAWRDLIRPKLQIRYKYLIEEQNRITGKIEKRSAIETVISQIREVLNREICPTCGQKVDEIKRNEAWRKVGEMESELRGLSESNDSLTNISAEISLLNGLMEGGVGVKIREKDRDINQKEIKLTQVENEMENLKEEIKDKDIDEIARKRKLRDALLKEEGRIELSIEENRKLLNKYNLELEIISKQLNNLPQAREARSNDLVHIYTILEKTFKESIDLLRDDLRKNVESSASKAFLSMISQKAFSGLEINSNYGLTILDEIGRPVPLRSTGAEQIVALSLIDALGHSGRESVPVIMDTPLGRLDLKHRENILKYLPTSASQMVLLVHDGEIKKDSELLAPIASQIGAKYNIIQIGLRHSRIERSLD